MSGFIKDVVAGGDFKRFDELLLLPAFEVFVMAANIKHKDYVIFKEHERMKIESQNKK